MSSRIDYEDPEYLGEYGPNELVPVITAAGPDHEDPSQRAASDSTDLRPLGSRLRRTTTPSRWTATS
ncbi:hypothetical protein AB0K62_23810 [Streptomyces halstedii]|uniref:hypothetical protein n=1 Tax=Streptomyces TaxID=1883 RepID=UPI000AD49A78|nr:hypothetical protein [Streptomyces sp. NTK 937]